ncbi:NnrS family protein [Ruegeria sp. HKCCD8929]|uniref:NnrS family protein n=1 Tax=Ruegeria sp. HKCCD8929 TaxID=2683006 RepID=UPI00148988D9|nr:NnrS family protein [Ruegeria sp. HKCCD8929]
MLNRLFSEGFRVFFLAAGLYGVFTGLIWVLYLGGATAGPASSQAPVLWHAHEMIFGYATAAIGGFFLTAVPNWTGAPGARQGFIALAAGLWLAGRLAVWYAGLLPPVLVAALDLSFIPVLALKILTQLLKRPKPQNVMFLLFLSYIWAANLLVHLEWTGATSDTALAGLRGGLIAVTALISVLGGRVTPAFTRNAMKRAGVPEARWPHSAKPVERAALILALLLPILVMTGLPAQAIAPAAILFGLLQIARLARWGGAWCLNKPILLALHLGLAMLALGMLLWGLSGLGIGNELAGLHILGIGCVGGMTLAVMSRAALGHSGRPLVASAPMALGYGLMAAAALLRWAGTEIDSLYLPAMLATGGLWTAAFTLYLMAMWPALTGPRVTTAE